VIDGLDDAHAWHHTPYGRATVGWRRRPDNDIHVDAHIPPNTTATVVLPSGAEHEIGSGTHHWCDTPPDQHHISTQPLTLASTLAEIIDNPAAHHAVIAAIAATDPTRAATFRQTTRWRAGRTLHEALNKAPVPILHAVQHALATATQHSGN
jgi:alpha-L-rhamnosidase